MVWEQMASAFSLEVPEMDDNSAMGRESMKVLSHCKYF